MAETKSLNHKKPKSSHITARPLKLWHDQHRIQEDVQVNIIPFIPVKGVITETAEQEVIVNCTVVNWH